MERLNKSELLQLLQSAVQEEIELRNTIRSTMNSYITLLCSIVAAILTISSFTLSETFIKPITFVIGGLICSIISLVGYKHYKSDYVRQIETIVAQAKLQDVLGLTNGSLYPMNTYWKSESLLPQNFIETRKISKTSKEFVDWFIKNTDTKWIRLMYSCFFAIGLIILGIGCFMIVGLFK